MDILKGVQSFANNAGRSLGRGIFNFASSAPERYGSSAPTGGSGWGALPSPSNEFLSTSLFSPNITSSSPGNHVIAVKYYEEGCIDEPRVAIVKRKLKEDANINNNSEVDANTITGLEIVRIIKQDDAWLQQINPIQKVFLFRTEEFVPFQDMPTLNLDDDTHMVQESRSPMKDNAGSEYNSNIFDNDRPEKSFEREKQGLIFCIMRKQLEPLDPTHNYATQGKGTVFTVYVRRKMPVKKCMINNTLTLSWKPTDDNYEDQATRAVQNLSIEETNTDTIRYFNFKFNAYTRFKTGVAIPIVQDRFGKSVLKILLERRIDPSEILDDTPRDDIEDEGMGEGIGYLYDDNDYNGYEYSEHEEIEDIVKRENLEEEDVARLGFSRKVDLTKLTMQANFFAVQQQRRKNWANLKIPTQRSQVSDEVKTMIRSGIPHSLRRNLWLAMTINDASKFERNQSYSNYIDNMLQLFNSKGEANNLRVGSAKAGETITRIPSDEAVSPDIYGIDPIIVPDFGLNRKVSKVNQFLNERGFRAAKRVLCLLAEQNPDVEFCPILPDLVMLWLMFVREHECYAAVCEMINASRTHQWYFRLNKMQHVLMLKAFEEIIRKNLPDMYSHFKKVGFDLDKLTSRWFDRMFTGFLPSSLILRIMDVYLNEGVKILYRMGYAILYRFKSVLIQNGTDSAKIMAILKEIPSKLSNYNDNDEMMKIAFKLQLRRQQLQEFDDRFRDSIPLADLRVTYSPYYRPKIIHESKIIKNIQKWEHLFSWVPTKYFTIARELHMIFGTHTHGYNLNTLFNKCEQHQDAACNILLIECVPTGKSTQRSNSKGNNANPNNNGNSDGTSIVITSPTDKNPLLNAITGKKTIEQLENQKMILGAFSTETFLRTYEYHGNPETFVFRLDPIESKHSTRTNSNKYFQMGDGDSLIFGGGGGGPALQIDTELERGRSNKSDTFVMEEPLTIFTNTFHILQVEVYQLQN